MANNKKIAEFSPSAKVILQHSEEIMKGKPSKGGWYAFDCYLSSAKVYLSLLRKEGKQSITVKVKPSQYQRGCNGRDKAELFTKLAQFATHTPEYGGVLERLKQNESLVDEIYLIKQKLSGISGEEDTPEGVLVV